MKALGARGMLVAGIAAAMVILPAVAGAQLELRPDVKIPVLENFRPLPPDDPEFSAEIALLVKDAGLDERTTASDNPDNEEEWSSICIVDLTDINRPRVGSWEADNFVYPASTYKMYVVGEAVRQVCAGERSLDDPTTVAAHNMRSDTRLTTDQVMSLSEILRLTSQFSDNVAANVAIDVVDRERASALLRAMGCEGSDVTRKFMPRAREEDRYSSVPSTMTSARHLATFLWAVETGAIGGGHGRGLMKGYLGTNEKNKERLRAGLPASATIYSKTGWWSIFLSEAGIVEDGPVKYIFCVLAAERIEVAGPKIARLGRDVHDLLQARAAAK